MKLKEVRKRTRMEKKPMKQQYMVVLTICPLTDSNQRRLAGLEGNLAGGSTHVKRPVCGERVAGAVDTTGRDVLNQAPTYLRR